MKDVNKPVIKGEFPRSLMDIWEEYSPYSMVPQAKFLENVSLMGRWGHYVSGAFVECGTWKGGMSAAMMRVGGPQRLYHFFDSFEGLPKARGEVDGPQALRWQANTAAPGYYDNCSASLEEFAAVIRQVPVPNENISIHKGWFADTVPHVDISPIAVLRLDGDWYDSTMLCLVCLFPQIVPGGLCVIDDYAEWDGCAKAVHDYLSANRLAVRIERTPVAEVCYMVKG